ncbi:NAD-dependent epimerase/dehydratase family protein [Crossiella sp. CA198]|uniref:NAD-dependent epimerase/dehydratase family protein n=1 Tax=Crossiella sp. CA198 TaxID=3455607 RepID=UPI003F8D6AB8
MRVAVIGGAGFIGARLRTELTARGHTVLSPAARGIEILFLTARLSPAILRRILACAPRRLVCLSSDAAVQYGRPLVNATELTPRQPRSPSPLAAATARAETTLLATGLDTVLIRPRLLWGAGDPRTPRLRAAVRADRFRWIGGGSQLTDTTHVANAVHALLLAARRGRPGESYFVTDHDPVAYRHFIADLLAADGLTAPTRTIGYGRAHALTALSETAWQALRLPGPPPLDYLTLWRAGLEGTLDISKARVQLGYEPVRTRGQGLAELRDDLACAV